MISANTRISETEDQSKMCEVLGSDLFIYKISTCKYHRVWTAIRLPEFKPLKIEYIKVSNQQTMLKISAKHKSLLNSYYYMMNFIKYRKSMWTLSTEFKNLENKALLRTISKSSIEVLIWTDLLLTNYCLQKWKIFSKQERTDYFSTQKYLRKNPSGHCFGLVTVLFFQP